MFDNDKLQQTPILKQRQREGETPFSITLTVNSLLNLQMVFQLEITT